jgi:hypothetical protein
MCNLSSVVVNCDNISAPGNAIDLYFTPAEELTGYPLTRFETLDTNNTAADKKTLNTAFAFVATTKIGYFRRVKAVLNSPITNSTLQGDGGAAGFENKLDFEIADDGAEARLFADDLAACKRCGDGVVVLVKNPDTGHFTVIGTRDRPAVLMAADLTSGDKPGGTARGSKFTVSAVAKNTPHIYPSNLTLKVVANV